VNLAFRLPAALAALAAVLIPLVIHLARRSEQRPTVFAALRWLRQKPKPRHRIRFDERLLLVLRALLVCLFATLLARPVLFGAQSHQAVVAVAPGVPASSVPKDARRLQPGIPITSQLRELDAMLPNDVALTVLVPRVLDGVDAEIPKLSRRVEWNVVDGEPLPAQTPPEAAPSLAVRYAPQRASSVPYLRAAAHAWQSPAPSGRVGIAPDVASTTRPIARGTPYLAWLSAGPIPADVLEWTRAGGTLLVETDATIADTPRMQAAWRDDNGTTWLESASFGRGRLLRFTHALTPAEMPVLLEGAFPRELRAALTQPTPAPARVLASAHAPTTGAAPYAPRPRDLDPWLLWLIAGLFAIERWIATGARRGVAA